MRYFTSSYEMQPLQERGVMQLRVAAIPRPFAIGRVMVSSGAVPLDVTNQFGLHRSTDTAAGWADPSIPAKPSDPLTSTVNVAFVRGGPSPVGFTYDADSLLDFTVNQQRSFTWTARPGREIKHVDTNSSVVLWAHSIQSSPMTAFTMAWGQM